MMSTSTPTLNLKGDLQEVEKYEFEPIQGYPMLNWKGKRPFNSTQFYPAQLKETYGADVEGWRNKIYWGDNLQVMSHLLKEYRGKIKLVYIDPPFDSNAEYKKKIKLRGKTAKTDHNFFEEKQYTDIWSNDEYLQFMYERLILLKELLASDGSIYLHCDYRRGHYLRCIMDEVFGGDALRAEIMWKKATKTTSFNNFGSEHDSILYYSKTQNPLYNQQFRELEQEQIKKNYVFVELGDKSYIRLSRRQIDGCEEIPKGRRFRTIPITNMNEDRPNLRFEFFGHTKTWAKGKEELQKDLDAGLIIQVGEGTIPVKKQYLDKNKGVKVNDVWTDIANIQGGAYENTKYPTQKPEAILERIMKASSNTNDLVFDCFMGSGTTQAVATKLGRKFIGCDINLASIQITLQRLLETGQSLQLQKPALIFGSEPKVFTTINEETGEEIEVIEEIVQTFYTGFEVYNVNHYDVFRNPVQAKELLIEALEIQPLAQSAGSVYDGEKDGRMVKIMPINRIATRADLNELIAGFDYKTFERRHAESPTKPVEKLLLVCMGHEPDLAAVLKTQVHPFSLDVKVVDVLRDEARLEFRRSSEARVSARDGKLRIENFYPMNLLQKLSLMKEDVEDWRELVESVMIDWNYDGAVLTPAVLDIPAGNQLVSGSYDVPPDAGTIRVKITDLLSESWEGDVHHA